MLTFYFAGDLLSSLELSQSGILEKKWKMDHVSQVRVSADARFGEHLVQVQLDCL